MGCAQSYECVRGRLILPKAKPFGLRNPFRLTVKSGRLINAISISQAHQDQSTTPSDQFSNGFIQFDSEIDAILDMSFTQHGKRFVSDLVFRIRRCDGREEKIGPFGTAGSALAQLKGEYRKFQNLSPGDRILYTSQPSKPYGAFVVQELSLDRDTRKNWDDSSGYTAQVGRPIGTQGAGRTTHRGARRKWDDLSHENDKDAHGHADRISYGPPPSQPVHKPEVVEEPGQLVYRV